MNTVTTTDTELSSKSPTPKAIRDEHERAQRSRDNAVAHALTCGRLLIAAKATKRRGSFQRYVTEVCRIPYPTAARYMKAAKQESTGVEVSSLRQVFPSGRPQATGDTSKARRADSRGTTKAEALPVAAVPDIATTDRETMLAAIKVAITTFADRHGWGAAAMDVGAWIESQAETGSAT